MKKSYIDRVLQKGSVREKIKLYLTDQANIILFNKEPKLSPEIGILILDSMTTHNDSKYYNELKTSFKSFLLYSENIPRLINNMKYLISQISKYVNISLIHRGYEEAINNILAAVEDNTMRDILMKTALENLQKFDAIHITTNTNNTDRMPFIIIPEGSDKIKLLIEMLNEDIKDAKEYIEGLRLFANKKIPLTPMKKFLKDGEKNIKSQIEEAQEIIVNYLCGKTTQNPLDKAMVLYNGFGIHDDSWFITLYEDTNIDLNGDVVEQIAKAGR